jgi:hypothetical protein
MTNDWKETLEWYDEHQTASQIGFDPDGMCLKICRTARGIGSFFLTAKQAQDATPKEHRVQKVADLRRGMVLFFDDPNDSNRAGHIVTMIGRVKGADRGDMHDVLVETNSVVSGQVVVVRGDYFKEHWGDSFQFGATWLNGVTLDVPLPKPKPPSGEVRIEHFKATAPQWDVKILDRLAKAGRRDVALKIREITETVENLPKDVKDTRVHQFKDIYEEKRILDMPLLNGAVRDGRSGRVKDGRDRLRQLIKSVMKN